MLQTYVHHLYLVIFALFKRNFEPTVNYIANIRYTIEVNKDKNSKNIAMAK